jgi:hypothetical protein
MELAKQLRDAASHAPTGLMELLHQAAEEFDMLHAAVEDCEKVMLEAVKEAIRNERSACATLADEVGSAEAGKAIRNRPPV